MTGPATPESPRQDFERRLEQARATSRGAAPARDEANVEASDEASDEARERARAMGLGFRIASELLATFLVAGAIGLLIDRVFGTTPWGMLAGLFLGFAAGILNVMRATKNPADSDKNKVDIPETLPHDDSDTRDGR